MSSAIATPSSHQQQVPVPMIQGVLFRPETDVKYSKSKVNSSGGKSVGVVNAHTGQSLFLGTPLLMTWGIQEFVDEKTKKVSYDMALQFPSEEYQSADSKAFLEAMVAFEKKLKADALVNSKDWFAKPKMTPDAIDALFTPVLKYPVDKVTCEKDTSKAPTMKIKVPFWNNKWEGIEVYDADKVCLYPSASNPSVSPKDLITKMSHVVTMVQCGGVWFANGKFGVTWRLVQGIVQPRLSMRGRCHLSLTPSETVKLHSEADKQQQQQQQFCDDDDVPSSVPVTETVDSDDGESEEEDDGGLARMPSLPVAAAAPPIQPQSVASAEAPKKKIIKKAV